MSTPAGTGPQVPTEDKPKRGLSKYVARFKKALKSDGTSKRASVAGPSKTATTPAETSTSKAEEPKAQPGVAATTTPAEPEIKTYSRAQLDADRAKRLVERFNLSIEPHEWTITAAKDMQVQRIEKPIRMRVHRTCHRCGASFGANKTCVGCEHTRCTKCPRYPSKKTEKKTKEPVVVAAIAPTEAEQVKEPKETKEKFILAKPSRTGGQPLVRKKPRQRVRRTCHSCSTLFSSGTKECSNCGHIRCEDCPRDPAKKSHYPDGYPGDEPSPNSTRPKKYVCDDCKTRFEVPFDADTEQPLQCTSCNHTNTSRVKPRKITPPPDPELLKSVEAKLAAFKVSSG
ncbi:hypothetical protein PVAG01_00847 [Phlyctema vagabunda]|uniref:Zinc finger protein n=1 Tax=Phlyctema vagabunda TaxID=108571 RepID=A0ABR4PVF9_9HELO